MSALRNLLGALALFVRQAVRTVWPSTPMPNPPLPLTCMHCGKPIRPLAAPHPVGSAYPRMTVFVDGDGHIVCSPRSSLHRPAVPGGAP